MDHIKYQMAVFDLDGTIINSRPFHASVFEEFFRENWKPVPYQTCYDAVGATVRTVFESGGIPLEKHGKFYDMLYGYYERGADRFLEKTTLAEGVVQVLEKMREMGMKTAIVTNSLTPVLNMFLTHHNISGLFDAVIGADRDSLTKNERCRSLEETFGIHSSRILYVGDSESDFILANEMGYDACFAKTEIAWYKNENYIESELKPLYTVTEYAELLELLKEWERKQAAETAPA